MIERIEKAVTKQQIKEAKENGIIGGADSSSEASGSIFKKLMKKRKKKKNLKSNNEEQAKVADIQFSFNNHKLIEKLRERGGYIAYNKFDKMRETETEINEIMQDFDSLTVPTSAFITFESDDSKIAALNLDKEENELLEMPMEFHDASEPTDIIWENRRFSPRDYLIRTIIAYAIISVVLSISGIIIYRISQFAAEINAVFPKVNCSELLESYGTSIEEYAIQDYSYIIDNKGQQSSGCLQCYCYQ